ncbi:pyridoxamine 5-phosphate oxidase [Lentzea sp. PSKA42]|uniref:Pyridoxamine 5-phosphate oxidase n=1 Tax=Lentzea indica TaxID=2604800 RepID=A0ABX1FW41_9PSEU|nr:pyridoxamine 5'-phosphate oxidase family protein [Lentzea indica]NKE63264.1 pyridoxamine 5-phosphate oxidase [Lentzea indica]
MRPERVTEVMNDPLAQELLASAIPARLAYIGTDGFPRVIPVGVHWNGTRIVVGTPTNSAKVPALRANPKVALTVDTDVPPQKVLLVRGSAAVEIVDGVPDAYLAGVRKLVDRGHKDAAWFENFEQQVRGLYQRMALITITPEWAKLLDFETRIPKAVEDLVTGRASS